MNTWAGILLYQLWFSQILETSWKFLPGMKKLVPIGSAKTAHKGSTFICELISFNTNQNTGEKPTDTGAPFKFRKLDRSMMVAERTPQPSW